MLEFIRDYLPIVIVGAIIGAFALVFVLAYIALQKSKKPDEDTDRHMKDSEIIKRLLGYAKPYWKSFVVVFFVMVLSIGYEVTCLITPRVTRVYVEDGQVVHIHRPLVN